MLDERFDEERLELFCRTLRCRPELGKLVQRVELVPVIKGRFEASRIPLHLDNDGVDALVDLLSLLPNLKRVTLEDFGPAGLEGLLRALARLPRVSDIWVYVPKGGHEYGDMLWSRLAQIATLENLAVESNSRPLRLPRVTDPSLGLQCLRKLVLSDSVEADPETDLKSLAPNLEELWLRAYGFHGAASSMGRFLATAPPSLYRLHLDRTPAIHLALAPHLRELQVGQLCRLADALPDLARSRIETLRFEPYSAPSLEDLVSLLAGPFRMPRLRRLVLDHTDVYKPVTFHAKPTADNIRAELQSSLRWVRDLDSARAILDKYCTPWSVGSSADGVERILEAARTRGATVSGDALDCLAWDRLVEREFCAALVDWIADAKEILDGYLGRDEAAAAAEVRKCRPDLAAWFSAGNAPV